MKCCTKCNQIKELSEFYHRKNGKPFSNCIPCQKDKLKTYYKNNPEKVKKRTSQYYAENKEVLLEKQREYAKREDVQERNRRRKKTAGYRSWENNYRKERKNKDIEFRLAVALRNRINMFFRNKTDKPGSAVKDLGCTLSEFRSYLETKFTPEMNWENYGKYWHIDHIKALANFTLADPEQFKAACHYVNLQPLEAKENIRKGKK